MWGKNEPATDTTSNTQPTTDTSVADRDRGLSMAGNNEPPLDRDADRW